jgi:hypothetical protein
MNGQRILSWTTARYDCRLSHLIFSATYRQRNRWFRFLIPFFCRTTILMWPRQHDNTHVPPLKLDNHRKSKLARHHRCFLSLFELHASALAFTRRLHLRFKFVRLTSSIATNIASAASYLRHPDICYYSLAAAFSILMYMARIAFVYLGQSSFAAASRLYKLFKVILDLAWVGVAGRSAILLVVFVLNASFSFLSPVSVD